MRLKIYYRTRRGALVSLKKNKIENKYRSTDGAIFYYCPFCDSDMCVLMCATGCVPMLVPASMSRMVFVFPPKPCWRPPSCQGHEIEAMLFLPITCGINRKSITVPHQCKL